MGLGAAGCPTRRAVPLLAVVLTTVALNIGSALPVDFMHLLTLSPSLAMGSLWLLGAALVFTEFVAGRLGWIALLPLAVLAVGCVGGKTSNVPALLGGIGLAALACLLRPGVRARVWAAFGVVLVASAGAFVVLILGSAGNLTVQAGATAKVFHVLPNGSVLGAGRRHAGRRARAGDQVDRARRADRAPRDPRAAPRSGSGWAPALAGLVLMGGPRASRRQPALLPALGGRARRPCVSAWGLGEALRRMSSAALGVAVVVGVVAGAVSVVVGSAVTAAVKAAAALATAASGRGGREPADSAVSGRTRVGPAPAHPPLLSCCPTGSRGSRPTRCWALPVLLVVGAAVRARASPGPVPAGRPGRASSPGPW